MQDDDRIHISTRLSIHLSEDLNGHAYTVIDTDRWKERAALYSVGYRRAECAGVEEESVT